MADSDPDGLHINLLLTTLFLFHLPELIKAGKVYIVLSPIYKVVTARKEVIYLYDEKEAQKWFRTHRGFEATHIKGLGELNAEELYETTMNPANRKLIQIKPDNFEEIIELYSQLMGKNPSLRRDFIVKHKLKSIVSDEVYDESDDE